MHIAKGDTCHLRCGGALLARSVVFYGVTFRVAFYGYRGRWTYNLNGRLSKQDHPMDIVRTEQKEDS